MDNKFRSRKFILAAFASIIASIALFTIDFSGTSWVSAQTIILGLYGAANVGSKKLVKEDDGTS